MRFLAIAASLIATAAAAEDIGSAARGETLAREVCAVCHAIAPGEISPIAEAPEFAEIANLVSTTRQSLFVFLNTPHPTMPDLILEREESDDLIAYILSLKDG